jgi:hypothetical protein
VRRKGTFQECSTFRLLGRPRVRSDASRLRRLATRPPSAPPRTHRPGRSRRCGHASRNSMCVPVVSSSCVGRDEFFPRDQALLGHALSGSSASVDEVRSRASRKRVPKQSLGTRGKGTATHIAPRRGRPAERTDALARFFLKTARIFLDATNIFVNLVVTNLFVAPKPERPSCREIPRANRTMWSWPSSA